MASAQMPSGRSLLQDSDAWAFVQEWVVDKITFPTLLEKMKDFGDRYVDSDWSGIFTQLFSLSEDGNSADAVSFVEDKMQSLGVMIPSATNNSSAKGKRKALPSAHRPRLSKRSHRETNPFLDVEAHVDNEVDSSSEEDGDDNNDIGTTSRRMIHPLRIYRASDHTGPSSYHRAVDGIAKRYLPTALDSLDDDEFNRQLDIFVGQNPLGEGEGEEREEGETEIEEEEVESRKVMDEPEIWGSIRRWILGTLDYGMLVDLIDHQYPFNPKIQYWEDFLSKLAYIDDLDKREDLFRSVSLADHLHLIADYRSAVTRPESPCFSPTQSSEVTMADSAWAVTIVPRSSADYIVSAWKSVSLTATAYKVLPGRVTVCAPHPRIFLDAVPLSHRDCIRGWSLIPFEDRISPLLHGQPAPSVPAWYTVLKRGPYKGDIAYATSFDETTGEFHILLAPRKLTPKKRPADHEGVGQDPLARRLFNPEEHRGRLQRPYRGLPRYQYGRQTFIAGLLSLKLKTNQVTHLPAPSPQQITLHVGSMVNPPFMKATYRKYHQLFWNAGDRVLSSDPSHLGEHGNLVTIDREARSAVVRSFDGTEYPVVLNSLSRFYCLGDAVRVIEDPFSHPQSAYHEIIGHSGLITDIDCETGEITVTQGNMEFQVPGYLLESHSLDQRILTQAGVLNPSSVESPAEQVEIGDMVEVRSGFHTGKTGHIISVNRLAGTLVFASTHPTDLHRTYEVSIQSVTFTPDPRALKFSPERGYDVRPGDAVTVIRGEHRGRSGTVARVRLEEKLLDITPLLHTQAFFSLPIAHFAHSAPVKDRDENERYRGKEVLIIAGQHRGWRGTLATIGKDKCFVARGVSSLDSYSMDSVVVRGSETTLAGRRLTLQEILAVADAFARAEIPSTSGRSRTPPLCSGPEKNEAGAAQTSAWEVDNVNSWEVNDTTSNPWEVDDSDRAQLNEPPLKVHNFLLHPTVLRSLQNFHAVFQLTPGWDDTYTGRLVKTQVPNCLETDSGAVPRGQIAVSLTSRRSGAKLLHELIPETSMKVYPPVKKNSYCMVIEAKEGGENIGSVLFVKRLHKGDRVDVQRPDGTPASESSLPLSRVIVVEPRS